MKPFFIKATQPLPKGATPWCQTCGVAITVTKDKNAEVETTIELWTREGRATEDTPLCLSCHATLRKLCGIEDSKLENLT